MLRNFCSSDGVRIDHTDGEVDALFNFLVAMNVHGFVELGMHEGGLALCLTKEMPRFYYLGVTPCYDLLDEIVQLKSQHGKFITILVGDTISSEIITTISTWATDKWPVLYYCDGEDKQAQVNLYRNLVRYGDFIGAHDYWNKSRIIPELPDYPYGELKPEILDTDLKYLRHEFQSVKFAPLLNTRIAMYTRKVK